MPLDRRSVFVTVCLVAAFAGTAASQYRVNVADRDRNLARAAERDGRAKRVTLSPVRGTILDAQGRVLAETRGARAVIVEPKRVPRSDAFALAGGLAGSVAAADIIGARQSRREWSAGAEAVAIDDIARVRREFGAGGLDVMNGDRRFYPLGPSAACVVGDLRYVADTGSGPGTVTLGIERAAQAELAGKSGYIEAGIDRRAERRAELLGEVAMVPAQPGQTVQLTLDAEIQRVAYRALHRAVSASKAVSGVAIVIEPRTGRVLAMANVPSFDPNSDVPGHSRNFAGLNHATMTAYEPGSTFKIVTLAKALDLGLTTADETVTCRGSLDFAGMPPVRCDLHSGTRAHGPVNAERLVAKSCNVVTAVYALRLQNKLGRQGYYNYLKELGLFSPSGVGLPNETTGILNENDYAWRRQAATLGFGQSMAATALNVATVYAALGNGGLRMAPRLIDRIGDETLPLAPARRLFQPESAATVLKAMEAAVYAGTGKRAQVRGLTVAGKTGTAQRGNQSKNGYIAGFIGFLPAAQPRAAVFIQIDRPTQGSYYAGQVAAPVFAEIGAFLRDYWELNEPKASGLGGI